MCLNPIRIRNKGLAAHGGQEFLEVPCNHCEECRRVAQDGYFLRCLANFYDCPAEKGWSFHFITLTFAPAHLPRTYFWRERISSSFDEKDMSRFEPCGLQPCFNHDLIKRFLKNFRQYFRRDLKVPSESLPRLLVTSEFGEKNHRPHYHIVAAVPFNMSYKTLRDIVLRFWHYGFVKNNRLYIKNGQYVRRNTTNAFKYVCKYASKGNSWLPFYLKPYCKDGVLYDYISESIPRYNYSPRVFTTHGFGAALTSILTEDIYRSGKVTLPLPDNPKEPFHTFNIPSYYVRRYFTLRSDKRVLDNVVLRKFVPWQDDPIITKKQFTRTDVTYKSEYYALRAYRFLDGYETLFDSLRTELLEPSDSQTTAPFVECVSVGIPPIDTLNSRNLALYKYLYDYHSTVYDTLPFDVIDMDVDMKCALTWFTILDDFRKWNLERRSLKCQIQADLQASYVEQNHILSNSFNNLTS